MPKTKISEYSATANSNTDVASINIDEGCAPSGINNAIRAIMGHLKDFQSGTSNDPFTVGSSGSLTLSYGTANGVAYLNGSKVLTTGSALVFDGSNLGLGVTPKSSGNGVGYFEVANGGVIGAQGGSLQIGSNVYATSGTFKYASSNYATLLSQISGAYYFGIAPSGTAGNAISFTQAMTLDASGNLLVGQTSSLGKLTIYQPTGGTVIGANVDGSTASASTLLNVSGFGQASVAQIAMTAVTANVRPSLTFSLFNGGIDGFQERMRLDASGNLGIGVTPSAWGSGHKAIQIGSASVTNSSGDFLNLVGNAYYNGTNWIAQLGDTCALYQVNNGGAFVWSQAPVTTAGATATFTERMRLDSSGNLGIAQTDPTNNGVSGYTNLVIGNSTSTTAGITIRTANTGTPAPGIVFARGTGGANGKVYYDQSTDRLYCQAGGSGGVYLASAGTSWTSASDERVKDIIEPIENATQKLANWRTVIGKYKSDTDGVRRSFLIAQDVLTTFPEAVNTDKAEEYGLNYQDLIPLLVASIQELKAEFDAYKASHP